MKDTSKVRLMIPPRQPGFPDDTIILDERSMGQDRNLRGKKVSLIEVTAELTCQNDVRDLMRKLEWAYGFLDDERPEFFTQINPRQRPERY